MRAPFETVSLPQREAEAFLAGFDRVGHSALVVGPWFHTEFDESVDVFKDPHGLIQEARDFDLREWIARQAERDAHLESHLGGLLEAVMGPLTAAPRAAASDAERLVHARRRAIAEQHESPQFIRDIEGALGDLARMTDAELPNVPKFLNRLHEAGDKAVGLDDQLRIIQTMAQFLRDDKVARTNDATGVIWSTLDPAEVEPVETHRGEDLLFRFADTTAETVVAILPVDDPWAALAWMQQGNYMYHPVALLAVARDMAKRYGAMPVIATSDFIGFKAAKPAKESGDAIARAFQALGATTLNGIETPLAAPHLSDKKEWLAWWD